MSQKAFADNNRTAMTLWLEIKTPLGIFSPAELLLKDIGINISMSQDPSDRFRARYCWLMALQLSMSCDPFWVVLRRKPVG